MSCYVIFKNPIQKPDSNTTLCSIIMYEIIIMKNLKSKYYNQTNQLFFVKKRLSWQVTKNIINK